MAKTNRVCLIKSKDEQASDSHILSCQWISAKFRVSVIAKQTASAVRRQLTQSQLQPLRDWTAVRFSTLPVLNCGQTPWKSIRPETPPPRVKLQCLLGNVIWFISVCTRIVTAVLRLKITPYHWLLYAAAAFQTGPYRRSITGNVNDVTLPALASAWVRYRSKQPCIWWHLFQVRTTRQHAVRHAAGLPASGRRRLGNPTCRRIKLTNWRLVSEISYTVGAVSLNVRWSLVNITLVKDCTDHQHFNDGFQYEHW